MRIFPNFGESQGSGTLPASFSVPLRLPESTSLLIADNLHFHSRNHVRNLEHYARQRLQAMLLADILDRNEISHLIGACEK